MSRVPGPYRPLPAPPCRRTPPRPRSLAWWSAWTLSGGSRTRTWSWSWAGRAGTTSHRKGRPGPATRGRLGEGGQDTTLLRCDAGLATVGGLGGEAGGGGCPGQATRGQGGGGVTQRMRPRSGQATRGQGGGGVTQRMRPRSGQATMGQGGGGITQRMRPRSGQATRGQGGGGITQRMRPRSGQATRGQGGGGVTQRMRPRSGQEIGEGRGVGGRIGFEDRDQLCSLGRGA